MKLEWNGWDLSGDGQSPLMVSRPTDWKLSTGSVWFIPEETTISTDPDTPIYNQMTAMYALTGRVDIASHSELRGSLA